MDKHNIMKNNAKRSKRTLYKTHHEILRKIYHQNPVVRRLPLNVVIHGGYGKKNIGDDAILGMIIKGIKRYMPNAKITAIAYDPTEVKKLYKINAHYFISLGAFISIMKAHLYIIGGGGIVNIVNVFSGLQRCRIFDMKGKFIFLASIVAKMFGAKLIFYAVGTTSIPDPVVKFLFKMALNCADYISVRDPMSQRLIKSIGVKKHVSVVYDPAKELKPIDSSTARNLLMKEGINLNKFLVGINFRYTKEQKNDNQTVIEVVAKLVDWLIETYDAEIVFFPFSRHPKKRVENDTYFAYDIARRIKTQNIKSYKILKNEYTPEEMQGLLGQMQFCILERLHSIIFAYGAGVPFISISYNNKVSEFVKMIRYSQREIKLDELNFELLKEKVISLMS